VKAIPSQQQILRAIQEKNEQLREIKLAQERLAAQQKKLQKEVTEQKALVSPISKIPVEIISRIFAECIDLHNCGLPARSAMDDIFSLMLVCKYWCTVAVETPQMWTNYHLTPDINIPYLPSWLRRAGTLPLQIQIPVIGCGHVPLPTAALGSHISQLEKVWITHSEPVEVTASRFRQLLCALRDFSNLTQLEINLTAIVEEFPVNDARAFVTLPNLRDLIIEKSFIPFGIVAPKLEELQMIGCMMYTEHFWPMVKIATNLWRLTMLRTSISPLNPSKGNMGCRLPSITRAFIGLPTDDHRCFRNLVHGCSGTKYMNLSVKHDSEFMNAINPKAFQNLTTLSLTLSSAISTWHHFDQASLDVGYARKIHDWLSCCDNLETFYCFLPPSTGMSSMEYDSSLLLSYLLLGAPPNSKPPCPRLKSLELEGHAYFPAVFLRIVLERAALPDQIRAAGFNPKEFGSVTGRPQTFDFRCNANMLQRIPGGYEFRPCRIICHGWDDFYQKYRPFYTKEDEEIMTKLGKIEGQKRLDYMLKQLKIYREKSTPDFNPPTHMGLPYLEPPPNPLANFCQVFEEMMGFNDMYDEDEDEEDGAEDPSEEDDYDTDYETENDHDGDSVD
jgi:hypothetical protein